MPHDPTDQTILTKWGRITAQEWLRRRYVEGMEERFDDDCLAYLQENWPTPQQIQANCNARAHRRREQEAERKQRLKTKAIADSARAETYSWQTERTPTPKQLPIL